MRTGGSNKNLGGQLGSAALRYQLPCCWRASRERSFRFRGSIRETVAPSEATVARDPTMARLEALLLLAREPLSSRKLAKLAGLADGTKARTLVRALNSRYDIEGCAFRAEEVAGGFQLLTRPQFAPWLRQLDSVAAEVRLSAPAMETLAVVAYRQPVLRAEVEAVRGVQCGEILRQLIERDLIRVTGRSDDLGRPLLYGTTRRFLHVFGLRHLDELPCPASLAVPKTEPQKDVHPVENCPDPTSISANVPEESKVTTFTQPRRELTWHDEQHPPQDREFFNSELHGELEADDLDDEEDFDDDDLDDEDLNEDEEKDFDDEEEEEEEEEEEDDDDESDLEDEPWEEVDDDDEDEDEDDWEDDDDDWDDDDAWDDED